MKLIFCFVLFTGSTFAQGLELTSEYCESCTSSEREYLLYLPESYSDTGNYKLIIFLHGFQQQENWNVELLRNKGLMRVLGKTDVFIPYRDDYIVMAPFTKEEFWNMNQLKEMLDHIISRFSAISPDHVFVTGMSMGGKGTWDFAVRFPELITGIIPLWSNVNVGSYDGSDSTYSVCDLADVAIWTIDGGADPKFPIDEIKQDRDGSYRWGTGLVTDILTNDCPSQLDPISHTWTSKTHNGWEEIYDLTAGFDIYQWIDQLSKVNGEILLDGEPVVSIDPEMTISASSDRWSVFARAFDPENQTLTFDWKVIPDDPSKNFNVTAASSELILRNFDPGSYTLEYTVTDEDGNSKTVTSALHVVEDVSMFPAVETAEIYSYDNAISFQKVLSDSTALSFSSIGTDDLNFRAIGNTATNAIRFALDEVGNFRTESRTNIAYLGLESSKDYVAEEGTFVLTVTACPDNFCESFGLSRQYLVRLSSQALPVTFTEVNAIRKGNSVLVEWTTATEYGNSHFEVRRWAKNDAGKLLLGIVNKKDGNSIEKNYHYEDLNPPLEGAYYQVVNVDNDGKRQYSRILYIGSFRNTISIWPNPAKAGDPIYLQSLMPGDIPGVYTLHGQKVPVNYSQANSSIRIEEPGIYILKHPGDAGVHVRLVVGQ